MPLARVQRMRRPILAGSAFALALFGNLALAGAQEPPNGGALPPLPPTSGVALPPPGMAPPAPPPPPPGPPPSGGPFSRADRNPVTFEPESADLSLLGRAGVRPVTELTRFRHAWYYERGFAAAYATMCDGPCQLSLPAGEYHLALAKDGGRAIPAPPLVLTGPSTLHAEYSDRSGTRTAGVLVGLGGLAGGIVMIAEAVKSRQTCDDSGCYQDQKINGGLFAGGIVVMVASAIVGSILVMQPDRAFITVTPLSLSPVGRARESGEPIVGSLIPPQGLGLTMRL